MTEGQSIGQEGCQVEKKDRKEVEDAAMSD